MTTEYQFYKTWLHQKLTAGPGIINNVELGISKEAMHDQYPFKSTFCSLFASLKTSDIIIL